MITKVLPAIKQKWPDRNQNIVIQQDGASVHIDENDPQFVAACGHVGELEYFIDDTITEIIGLECS